jgi:hypothetical protein
LFNFVSTTFLHVTTLSQSEENKVNRRSSTLAGIIPGPNDVPIVKALRNPTQVILGGPIVSYDHMSSSLIRIGIGLRLLLPNIGNNH